MMSIRLCLCPLRTQYQPLRRTDRLQRAAGNLAAFGDRLRAAGIPADRLYLSGFVDRIKHKGARHASVQALPPLLHANASAIHEQLHRLRAGEDRHTDRLALLPRPVPAFSDIREAPRADDLHPACVLRVCAEHIGSGISPDHTPVSALRKQRSRDVKVRVVRRSPGIDGCLRGEHIRPLLQHRVVRFHGHRLADPGLPEIVERRPGEISDHVRRLLDHRPVNSDLLRKILTAQHHTLRISFMISRVAALHVIVSHNVETIGERLRVVLPQRAAGEIRVLPCGCARLLCLLKHLQHRLPVKTVPERTDRVRHRPRRIERLHLSRQLRRDAVSVPEAAPLRDLIAGGP